MTCHSDRETWSARGYEAEFRAFPGGWLVRLRHVSRGILYSDHGFPGRLQAHEEFEAIKQAIRAGFFRDIDLP